MGVERKDYTNPAEQEMPIAHSQIVTDLEYDYMLQAAEEIDGLTIKVTERPGESFRDVPQGSDPDKTSEIKPQIVADGYLRISITSSTLSAYITHGLKYIELVERYAQGARMVRGANPNN